MSTERSEQRWEHTPATESDGPPPPVTFTRAGVLGGDTLDVQDGLSSSDVWRCERCKALVLGEDAYDHLIYHSLLAMERWPDADTGNLPDTEGSG